MNKRSKNIIETVNKIKDASLLLKEIGEEDMGMIVLRISVVIKAYYSAETPNMNKLAEDQLHKIDKIMTLSDLPDEIRKMMRSKGLPN